jgi:hypothetical protein
MDSKEDPDMEQPARTTGVILLAIACIAGCGPKQAPATEPSVPQLTEHAAVQVDPDAEATQQKLTVLINEINAAIEGQNAEAFWSVFTNESRELFYQVARLDMAIAGVKDQSPSEHVLKQQKDFNVVYTIENVDTAEMTATLVGILRRTGDEVRFPLAFIEQDGKILIDYTQVLTERLDNLKVARMRSLIEELNTAIDVADADLFSAVLTDTTLTGCPDFLMKPAKPPKKAPKLTDILKGLQKAGIVVEIENEDASTMSASLAVVIGEGETRTVPVQFVFEEEVMRLDASGCKTAE